MERDGQAESSIELALRWTTRRLRATLRFMRRRSNEVEIERDVKVEMPDGVVLLTDVYHPVGVDDAPTLLESTPHGRPAIASALVPEFAGRGYRYLIQACRGTDGSGGSHSYFAEAPDGGAPAPR